MTDWKERNAELIAAAKSYAARGWRVHPVYPAKNGRCAWCAEKGKTCNAPGKHPVFLKWQEKATTNPVEIAHWWRLYPLSFVGIATGHGLAVVDIDPRNGGSESAAKLGIPETYTVETGGGGRHHYFTHEGKIRNSAGTIAPGIDLRGDDGFVVAPPSGHASGGTYQVLKDIELTPLPAWALNGHAKTTTAAPRPSHRAAIYEGGRNDHLTSEAGRLRNLGADEQELLAKLRVINLAHCSPPLPDDEVASIAQSIARYPTTRPLTDLGNAERLVDRHGDKIRFCAQQDSWYVWDGRRWRHDVTQGVARLAIDTVRSIYEEARAETNDERRKDIAEHALHSESSAGVSNMQRLAKALEAVAIRADVLDPDPWLLTVLNGTLDLHTGKLLPHDPEHLITKLAPVVYDANAQSELWEAFIRDVTSGDDELAAYLQAAAGYTLTGRTSEHAVFFIYGPSATGNTRFTSALKDMLGDYAIQTAFETFLAKRYGGGGSNDIADLAGARLVLATEADRGRKFAEATLKQLTGGDTIRARQLYERNFEFKPMFKLWLAANDAPKVNNDDDAIFRRMNIVPFTRIVPTELRDKDLGDKLATPELRSAILAWAVRGCSAWQSDGLRVPKVVSEATTQYRDEQDPLQFFLDEWCELSPGYSISKAQLWQAYVEWAKADSLRFPLTRREFTTRIAKLPQITEARGTGGTHMWRGIDVQESPAWGAQPQQSKADQ